MWVRFLKNASWKPTPNTTNDYLLGHEVNLPTAAAEKLIAAGKAEAIEGKGMPKKSGKSAMKPVVEDAPGDNGEPAADPAADTGK